MTSLGRDNIVRSVPDRPINGALIAGLAVFFWLLAAGVISFSAQADANGAPTSSPAASGPLRVCKDNPRYFADAGGRAILLTGSHTWPTVVDIGKTNPPEVFNVPAFLDFIVARGHNFSRLWTWETTTWGEHVNPTRKEAIEYARPLAYARTGPGAALDGLKKYDLTRYDPEYFERLRSRVAMAQARGIYVSIMLFEGWAPQFNRNCWAGHPFHAPNNFNGIEADKNGDGLGMEAHELGNPKITALQEAYVRKVIDTVNGFDNVLYEISNENHPDSTEWQYHFIRFIKEYEKTKPKQHPVGMTFQYKGGSNKTLFDSPADWISPNPDGGYRDNPPPADGTKVILNDTDHLWGIGGNTAWVWKSFTRGMNPLFMDPYDEKVLGKGKDAEWEIVRKSMGYALKLARRVDLNAMTPRGSLASSQYCLANPGKEYLVYLPEGKETTVDVGAAELSFDVEWLNPDTGETQKGQPARGSGSLRFASPLQTKHAVLYLKRANP